MTVIIVYKASICNNKITCAANFRTSELVSAHRGRYAITLSPRLRESRLGNTKAAEKNKEIEHKNVIFNVNMERAKKY